MYGARKVVRERLLSELLSTVVDPAGGGWKVLIMDGLTTRIMSSALRMSDILDTGVSVVEDLEKQREPLPLAAIYFITPSPASVARLLADFDSKPLYPSAHVFFSNRVTPDTVERIKRCRALLPVLRSLKEFNLEVTLLDARTFCTEHPHALVRCMGERSEAAQQECDLELESMASRIVTLLASLHEFPTIRYRAGAPGGWGRGARLAAPLAVQLPVSQPRLCIASMHARARAPPTKPAALPRVWALRAGKPPEPGDAPGAAARATLTQQLAQKLSARALAAQRGGTLPPRETCDVLVLDRSVDPVAPVVHEWTYEALVHDLLPVEDSVIRYTAESAAGRAEVKEHMLDDATDELWAELRHAHIADVYTTLSRRFTEFSDKNKAAKYQAGKGAAGGSMSTGNIKALIQALPQFRDVLGRLSVHIFISSELKAAINARGLTDLGELEQALVYGERNSQDLIRFLADHGARLEPSDKMRLFAAYLATHPEKLDATKRAQWQKLARLDSQDMQAVCNLAFLNVAVMQREGAAARSGLSFGFKPKKKKATYRKREGGEEQYALSRFDPVLLDVLEAAAKGQLSSDEYPYVRPPVEDDFGSPESLRIASARTNRSATTWARRGPGSGVDAAGGAGSGVLGSVTGALQSLGLGSVTSGTSGRRLLVFVVGGITRSEMRAAHEASAKLGREVLLGSSGVLRPASFLSQLRSMGAAS